ncbi:SubName: Full=Related to FPR2-FK506/rapamycin-binding protein of the ER {ECO:0000313/EMBL:CCA74884.1} [Serendipita indica DSM 11827]|uniref:peptidylprolyl isomerase n=2 Tax=Serendipita indica (strain DSM 11827) TaxID=1109443 RepID=G4TU91_SERID|nr:SubName: Full=Related to FPR2-FK506/rapamycin-binding protein of the ER {ECO:0000313/EMBL:CCA74884.1} [Serendipita indica DSM 11827]CCA74884.1 related to FPR2-FK506/rapamycin-binding protein of the ER [Serendipita indica DSM 11827]
MSSPPADLVIEVVSKPASSGVTSAAGDKIQVHYTGKLFSNGSKFDSSVDRGKPLAITLGVGQVIKGWDEGLVGMVIGEKRKLTIPAHKAYGDRGFTNLIPPNSCLVFDVEMVDIQKA